jgi:hypothetical protein
MKFVTILAVAMALGSCSYAYEVTVIAKNGCIVFIIASSGLFGSRIPYVNYVDVERIDNPTKPVWKLETTRPNGPEMHELRYGEVPEGMKTAIGPTPLSIGPSYRVTVLTIDGGGYREFAISSDGKVINTNH